MPIQWRDVTHGVREEDGPAVANVVVELNGTVGGVGLEVGGNGAETEAIQKLKSVHTAQV